MTPRPAPEENAVTRAPLPPAAADKGPRSPVPGPLDAIAQTLGPAQSALAMIQAGVAQLAGMGNPAIQPMLAQISEAMNGIMPALVMPMMIGGGLTPPPPGAPPTGMPGSPGMPGQPPMPGQPGMGGM